MYQNVLTPRKSMLTRIQTQVWALFLAAIIMPTVATDKVGARDSHDAQGATHVRTSAGTKTNSADGKRASKKIRFKHTVSCFGLSNAASKQALESILNAGWELPTLNKDYYVLGSFQINADSHISNAKILQSSGLTAVDDAALMQIQHLQAQIQNNVKVSRDTEVLAAFSFAAKGYPAVILRAADSDVLCAIKTRDKFQPTEYDEDDEEEIDEAENLDPWTAWAAKVCRAVAANINNVMQLPKNHNLYLPVHSNVVLQVEVGSDKPVKVLNLVKGSGNAQFDNSVDEGIRMLNESNTISLPKGTNLKGQMTVHLIELVSH